MKLAKLSLPLFFLMFAFSLHAQFSPFQNESQYSVFIDLLKLEKDRVPVTIVPPVISEEEVEFHIPRIIPGTYDIADYGRYVSEVMAYDAQGEELPVEQLDYNRWNIKQARKLYRITYLVDDTFDSETPSDIFQPAGTSLERDSVYLLNNFGFVGYLNAYEDVPYDLHISKPRGFYGSTSLNGERGDSIDVFRAEDYFAVHDNPIMYCVPDTAVKYVGGARVMVSFYSPNRTVSADTAMKHVAEVLEAAAEYLGGQLPVENYTVLVYCVPLQKAGSSYGALEHHTSTVLYMPEFGGDKFYQGVRDITSHEFFHIITPLNIHSQYISDFDFIDPEMSRHIWFYEGVTEYNSHLVQMRSDIYSMEEFLDIMREKIVSADDFNQDIPLTLASQFTLSFFKDQYYNFYQKGAVAGMALDLKLRELSDGEYGLLHLLKELEQTYGRDTFFRDEDFFDIIAEMTFPGIREFFARYFEGSEELPLADLLAVAGIEYRPVLQSQRISTGNMDVGYNFETKRLRVEGTDELDEFGKALGLKVGDEIIEFNGRKIDINNISEVIAQFYAEVEPGDKVSIVVARPEGGDFKTRKLKARAILTSVEYEHYMAPADAPSEEQLEIRKGWLGQ